MVTPSNLWVEGYRLCQAEIVFETNDKPCVYQQMTWQQLDQAPDFPVLNSFLRDWEQAGDVRFHSIQVSALKNVSLEELRGAGFSMMVH